MSEIRKRGRPRKAPEDRAPKRSGPSGRPVRSEPAEVAEYDRLKAEVEAAVEARGEGYGAGRKATLSDIARLTGEQHAVLVRRLELRGLAAMRRAHGALVQPAD